MVGEEFANEHLSRSNSQLWRPSVRTIASNILRMHSSCSSQVDFVNLQSKRRDRMCDARGSGAPLVGGSVGSLPSIEHWMEG